MKKININGISLALIYGMILIVLKILGLVEFSSRNNPANGFEKM